MAPRDLQREIDRLYQLPLDEFTAARNALAKTAGADAANVKTLQKPPIAAWAVNQLYWQQRKVYDALIEAAETLQASHKAVLSGKSADLRAAGKEHEAALEAALKAALAQLQEAGQPATDVTRQAIVTTLRALPADEPPGRLARVLQPSGFEALAGVPLRARTSTAAAPRGGTPSASARAQKAEPAGRDAKALAEARAAATTAARDLKIAEQAARREEFEAARGAREADKAARALQDARAELEAARRAVEDAEREAEAAMDRRRKAEARAREADAAAAKARARLAEAEARIRR